MTEQHRQWLDFGLKAAALVGGLLLASWAAFDRRYEHADDYRNDRLRDSLSLQQEFRAIRDWQTRRDTIDRGRDSTLRACIAKPVRCQ